MNVTFIGFGNMAKAIAQGLLKNNHFRVYACAPSLPAGFYQNKIETHFDNKKFLAHTDILLLAVKPLQMAAVIAEIKEALLPKTLVITIAAGLPTTWFNQQGLKNALVRAMPNIAASVGEAATPLFATSNVSEKGRVNAEAIFNQVGITTWAENEEALDAFTALSGSGPAYFFEFLNNLVKGATQLGLSEDIANKFTLQTMRGALHLAASTHTNFAELKQMVTSKKGTTEAALTVLAKQGFEDTIVNAMKAAFLRAQELGKN